MVAGASRVGAELWQAGQYIARILSGKEEMLVVKVSESVSGAAAMTRHQRRLRSGGAEV